MVKDTSKEFDDCIETLDKDLPNESGSLLDFFDEPVEEHNQSDWKTMWKGMPEFESDDKKPARKLIVSFETEEDFQKFAELTELPLTEKTRFVWWPEKQKYNLISKWFVDEDDV